MGVLASKETKVLFIMNNCLLPARMNELLWLISGAGRMGEYPGYRVDPTRYLGMVDLRHCHCLAQKKTPVEGTTKSENGTLSVSCLAMPSMVHRDYSLDVKCLCYCITS